MEPTLKYQPGIIGVLTQVRDPDRGQCVVGSLTGAVSSQRVTEEHEGALIMVGNHEVSVKAQARFCLYTLRTISDRAERTFVLLRYSLGGDRPSQTTHHTLSSIRITDQS